MTQTVNIRQAGKILRHCLISNYENQKAGTGAKPIVPMLMGMQGIGKTDCGRQSVHEPYNGLDMGMVEVALAQKDPTEVNGIQMPDLANDQTKNLKAHWYLEVVAKKTAGIEIGWVFGDEFPQAPVPTQNAIAPIMNDGMVGEYKLPDGWFFMCAGNRLKDKAGTNRIPTHIKDRVTFIYVEPDIDDFCDYATKSGWSPYIPAFMRFKGKEDPTVFCHSDPTQDSTSTPRAWQRANTILDMGLEGDLTCLQALLSGTLGEATTNSFMAFLEVVQTAPELTNLDAILDDPANAPICDRPDILFVLLGSLSARCTLDTFPAIAEYCVRLDNKDLLQVCVQDCMAVCSGVRSSATFKQLVADGHLNDIYV